jgi:site-specific DNA-methyltransferase (adenine-specific)
MHRFGDVGGASRFFYCAKPAKKEKNAGLDEPNPHPTVKSAKLMSWLINLITPPGGTVLDPFTGSGSTGVACATDGFEFIGIEQSEEYAEIAEKRIEYARKQKLVAEVREEQKKRNE